MAVKNYPIGTHFKGPIKLGNGSSLNKNQVGGIDATVTLTADEIKGQTYILDNANNAAAATITLPAPEAGCKVKFLLEDGGGANAFAFAATSGDFYGVFDDGGTRNALAGDTSLTLVSANTVTGDYIEFEAVVGNGLSFWQVSGATTTALTLTVA